MPIRKVSFENPHFTGTEAAKLPVGTTGQRANAVAGDQRFNTTTGLMEYYTGTAWKAIDTPPSVTSISPSSIGTGETENIVISGTNFASGSTVKAIGTDGSQVNASSITFNSTTQLTATFVGSSLSTSADNYNIEVTAPSGLKGTLDSALSVNTTPTWTTAAGNIGNAYDDISANLSIAASDTEGDTLTYSIASGSSLHGGLSLNSGTGAITGDPADVSGDTTNTFTAEVTDGTSTSSRIFNIIIKQALGTSTNPASSAKDLYDAGYTTSGNYFINNIYTGGSATEVYCKMGVDPNADGTLYHFQKFIPSSLGGFSQYGNFTPSSATLSTISTEDADFGTYNYRYTTSSSSSGAAGMRQTGLQVSQTDDSGWAVIVDHKANSYGDNANPIGDGGPVFDANTTGDASSNTNSHNYSNEWSNGVTNGEVNSAGGYYVYFMSFPRLNQGVSSYTNSLSGHLWYSGRGNSQANAWADLVSSNAEQHQRIGSAYTIGTSNYIGFKHQGWSDVGNSAQSDCIYWIAHKI